MTDEITIRIPECSCPECGREIDLDDDETKLVVIAICPHCRTSFEYSDEERLH